MTQASKTRTADNTAATLLRRLIVQAAIALCIGAMATATARAQTAPAGVAVPECVHDTAVTERFLPVELLTGNPMPDKPELSFAPVKRAYPFLNASADRAGEMQETTLEGPVQWAGHQGKVYEVYERKVPKANERFALTPDKTAIGRVYDERWGNATNEGKFPVGVELHRSLTLVFHRILTHPLCEQSSSRCG